MDFREMYDSYAPDVYRFSLWLTGSRTEAEDITSETMVRAWTRRETARTATLKAWLFTIARNIFLENLRKSRRSAELMDVHADPSPGPDRHAESRQELSMIERLLHDMAECDRTAFILRIRYEMPYSEIARILGISLASAKVKVHRIRKRLILEKIQREE
jgi:RNA polymerase sigma-70 factor (ECF subfamily)